MNAEVFIDTNVFICQLDTMDARKHKVAERIESMTIVNPFKA